MTRPHQKLLLASCTHERVTFKPCIMVYKTFHRLYDHLRLKTHGVENWRRFSDFRLIIRPISPIRYHTDQPCAAPAG